MATQVSLNYVGGPHGGQSALVDPGTLEQRFDLPGGSYALGKDDGDVDCYVWTPDPQRLDRTPRDGDEASALLAEHDGATPVLEQDVTSSTTIAAAPQVEAPKAQAKTATGSAAKRGLTTKS